MIDGRPDFFSRISHVNHFPLLNVLEGSERAVGERLDGKIIVPSAG